MQKFDYEKLGLKCGLEIHQQLDTATKLFCRCPSKLQGTREPDFTVKRTMRPVLGELGTYDEAMLTEYEKGMGIIYEGYNDVICTYELDETPPFGINVEAKTVAMEIALLLNSNIIEEMHVCRKNYLDGSVPCGFQRTMILGTGGWVELENGKQIGIDLLSLEEDAARKIKTEQKTNYFRLDRLGIPLVEVTTKPDIRSPDECRETAERLGLLLWSTRVKKVLGSIRQDINVSIKAGTRVEIKGVQKLDWIPILINREVSRQLNLIEIKEELAKRKLSEKDIPSKPIDLTDIINRDELNFLAEGINLGKKLHGINFFGFKGIFGKELIENYRFGTEISSKVKSISGLKGIIHSDENLKKYKLSDENILKLQEKLKSSDKDCFVLVLGYKNEIDKAMEVIINRVKTAFKGVPPETRRAGEDGNTEFLRELHGGARLYPDTDSKAILNTDIEIKDVKNNLPEYPWILIKNYVKKYKTQERLIKDLIFEGIVDLFDKIISFYDENPSLVITTLLETTKELSRDGKFVENLSEQDFIDIFTLLKKKEIGKEAIREFISAKADSPELTIDQIKKKLKIHPLSIEELREIINKIVKIKIDMLKEKGMRAKGPIMGLVMKQVRGKIDGSIVSEELESILKQALKELQ